MRGATVLVSASARRLVWIGALLLNGAPPLEGLAGHPPHLAAEAFFIKILWVGQGITGLDVLGPRLSPAVWTALFVLACTLPSVLAAIRPPARRLQALTLIGFAPLYAFACVVAYRSAELSSRVLRPQVALGPTASAGILAAGALALPLLRRRGASGERLAAGARVLLALAVPWLFVLEWNGWRLQAWHPPLWTAVLGAALLTTGEIAGRGPARPDS